MDDINIERLRRSWKTKDDDTTMHCYLSMRHRITVRELHDYLHENHPHVDPWEVELNFATATWDEPSTEADRAEREAWRTHQADRHAAWERDMYARLRAKFEPSEVSE